MRVLFYSFSGHQNHDVNKNDKERIHEMIVFHKKGSYVRPHKHLNKLESFFIISGEVTLVIFDKKGIPIKKNVFLDCFRILYFCYRIDS